MPEIVPADDRNPQRPRPMPLAQRLLYLALVVGVPALALFMARGPILRWFTASSGEHLTFDEASRSGIALDLPPEASDIRFYQHLQPDRVVIVDFAIGEDAFLQWAERQGWQPQKITGSITIRPRAAFGDRNTTVEVRDGYFAHTLLPEESETFSVVYDRSSGRAYYHFDSAPPGD
ncbi:MAG TPA: hypothetical protein VNK04_22315 [Gemmataceae bacterium]|nr:hypothetical protein [Gemmataceae bacterium]